MVENTGDGGSDPIAGAPRQNPLALREYMEKHRDMRSRGDERSIQESTVNNYIKFIDSYLNTVQLAQTRQWAEEEQKVEIVESIEDWLEDVQESRGWKPSTCGIAAFSVQSFYQTMYLYTIDHKVLPYAGNVDKADEDFDPRIWSEDELQEVFSFIGTMDHDRLEDAITIGWKCICRNAEIAHLERGDVDMSKPAVTIRGVKGSGNFTFTPDDELLSVSTVTQKSLWDALDRRLDVAAANDSKYLFPSQTDTGHIDAGTIGYWFGNECCKWKLYDEYRGMHALCRHTRISMLYEEGFSTDDIQRWARHKYPTTTQRYDNQDILRKL